MKIDAEKTASCILSICFVFIIFNIGYVPAPKTFDVIKEFVKTRGISFNDAETKLASVYNDILTFSGNILQHKGTHINLHGLMAHLMGKRLLNGIVRMNNGQLATTDVAGVQTQKRTVSNNLEYTIAYKKQLDSMNVYFLYVAAPTIICKYDPQLPFGTTDFSNEIMDEFLEGLKSANIDFIDLREELHKDGLDHHKAFPNTDPHWKPEIGFWAAKKITEHLSKQGVLPVTHELDDINNYNIDTHKNISIGYCAAKTGTTFAGIGTKFYGKDDISLIYPKFNTKITALYPAGDLVVDDSTAHNSVTDSFYNTFFRTEGLKSNWLNSAYMAGLFPQTTTYANNNAQNNTKILLFGDSFTAVIIPFLAITQNKIFARLWKKSTITDVQTTKPDVVIMVNVGTNFVGYLSE